MSLAARDVTIRFGGLLAVNAMSIDVAPGEIVGLIGPNGAGKTTFINCIAGASRAQAGAITWRGLSLTGLAPHQIIAQGVVRTFQNVASLHGLSVLDIVKLGATMKHRSSAWRGIGRFFASERQRDDDLIEHILEPLRLADVARKQLQTLPYGLRKGVDLARALAVDPQLLLLDEPVAGLTAPEAERMAGVVRDVRKRLGCAILMVEHKMDVVNTTCDRIVVMAAGARLFEGSPADVQKDSEVRRVYLGEP
jgi:branched-chain amino acid transport system ATP-binding protein